MNKRLVSKTERGNDALVKNGDSDYTLKHQSAWITVGNLSVYINRTDEGVVVDIFKKERETDDPITGTYASFCEAEACES